MLSYIKHIDALLRGERTEHANLMQSGTALPLRVFVPAALVLGGIYGFFMAWYALGHGGSGALLHVASTTVKLPLLFLATLVVTFPSLYIFNALVGCRLDFLATLRLLVAAVVVNLAIGASLGPILGFFTLSTKNYHFMVLLNVVLLGLAGAISLAFLFRTLRLLAAATLAKLPDAPEDSAPALGVANTIFRVWVIIYGLVGAQMGWILRPFIGAPDQPFALLRPRDGNVFISIGQSIRGVLGW